MPKWIMPHEVEGDAVLPMKQKPRYILPHEVEAAEAEKPTIAEETLAAESPASRALIGAGQRLSNVVAGAKQKAGMLGNLLPFAKNEWPNEVAAQLKDEAPFQQALNKDQYAGYGRLGTDVALGMLGPSRTLAGAAVTGGVINTLNPEEDPTLGNTIMDFAKGAGLGAATAGALNTALTGVAKGKNALQGRFANPEYENRFRIFKQNQVPGSLGDITQNPTTMGLENVAQYVPLTGRKDFLERQAARLGEVVEGAPEKIVGATPAQSKEDIGSVLASSIKQKYASAKTASRGLYDQVEARVQAVGNPPVTPTKMANEVNTLLGKYPSAFAKLSDDPDTVQTLQTIATGVKPGQSPILGPNGKPILTPPNLTFSELRQLDSDLGAMIRQGRQLTARGEMNNKSFDQLVKIQKALREDITDWSQQVGDPQISQGVSQANKFFRENVVPFRKNRLTRKVIQDESYNPDTLAQSMFKLDSPYLSEQARQFLTPEGIQAGRFHLLNQAKRKAMDDALASGYSPSRFLKNTELGETGPKLFSDDELGQVADLQELIGSSRRAASYSADPATGNRLAMLSPFVSWKIPLAGRLFSTMSQSEAPMRFMLANPNLYVGTGALGRVSEEALRKSGAGLGVGLSELP